MQKWVNFLLWSFVFVGGGFLLFQIFQNKHQQVTKEKYYTYFSTPIYIKITTQNNSIEKVWEEIDQIYKTYDRLVDPKTIDGYNLAYILKNQEEKEVITIDEKLYNLIRYGIDCYQKTDGFIDISKGNLFDVWENAKKEKRIPTLTELKQKDTFSISDIRLLDKNQIINRHVNMNLDLIVRGYTTNLIKQYLEKENILDYIIMMDGLTVVGKRKEPYRIALEDLHSLNQETSLTLTMHEKTLSSSASIKNMYLYQDRYYSSLINPKTYFPNTDLFQVHVISKDPREADLYRQYLSLLSIEQGLQISNQISSIEALYYLNSDHIQKSDHFDELLLK